MGVFDLGPCSKRPVTMREQTGNLVTRDNRACPASACTQSPPKQPLRKLHPGFAFLGLSLFAHGPLGAEDVSSRNLAVQSSRGSRDKAPPGFFGALKGFQADPLDDRGSWGPPQVSAPWPKDKTNETQPDQLPRPRRQEGGRRHERRRRLGSSRIVMEPGAVAASPKGVRGSKRTLSVFGWHDHEIGRPFADGSIYSPDVVAFASNEFKLGTMVTVTTPDGGSLTAPVKDRMARRFSHRRVDLTVAAWRQLSSLGYGLIRGARVEAAR